MDILLQQIVNGLVLGSIYALIALGYTMVYGILGIINFAHGEVLMVGAMVSLTDHFDHAVTSRITIVGHAIDCFIRGNGSLRGTQLSD